jgi:hypothetical protein
MKTIKTMITLCIILCFATNAMNAQTVQQHQLNLSFIVYIPCASEWASGSMPMHVLQIFDNKDGWYTKYHAQVQGGVLIGETTGTVYRTVGVSQEMSIKANNAGNITFINNIHMASKGGIQLSIHVLSHVTSNSNEDITVDFENITVECSDYIWRF